METAVLNVAAFPATGVTEARKVRFSGSTGLCEEQAQTNPTAATIDITRFIVPPDRRSADE
jgi:hypothetical protein